LPAARRRGSAHTRQTGRRRAGRPPPWPGPRTCAGRCVCVGGGWGGGGRGRGGVGLRLDNTGACPAAGPALSPRAPAPCPPARPPAPGQELVQQRLGARGRGGRRLRHPALQQAPGHAVTELGGAAAAGGPWVGMQRACAVGGGGGGGGGGVGGGGRGLGAAPAEPGVCTALLPARQRCRPCCNHAEVSNYRMSLP
jgi:hypothetical protein